VDEAQSTHHERVIELQCPIRSAAILGDELRLEQVIQNLIQNAVKYSPPATPVFVAVRQDGAQVCVEVRDRGIGIPQAALSQLFERFYRAPNVLEGSAAGMGIGLFVVKEIVELHGGQVTVESTEGEGSTFTVCLPRSSA
jgi:signal transduction histidine kinase